VRTERDDSVLETLATKVRVLTLDQIAAVWWPLSAGPRSDARKRLGKLPVHMHTALVSRTPTREPVFRWSPDRPEPVNFERLAYRLRKRWDTPRPTVVVSVVGRRPVRATALTHDIHVSAIYLEHYYPDFADRCIHEDVLPPAATERPDAIVRGGAPDGTDLIIEHGGSYSAAKLRAKHDAYKHSYYELW